MSGIECLGGASGDRVAYLRHHFHGPKAHGGNPASLATALDGQDGSGTKAGPQGWGGIFSVRCGSMPTLLSAQEEASSTGASAQGSTFVDRLFAKLDVDGDGKIDKSELEAAFTAKGRDTDRLDAIFARLDDDGDGSVSQNELAAGIRHGHGHGGWR